MTPRPSVYPEITTYQPHSASSPAWIKARVPKLMSLLLLLPNTHPAPNKVHSPSNTRATLSKSKSEYIPSPFQAMGLGVEAGAHKGLQAGHSALSHAHSTPTSFPRLLRCSLHQAKPASLLSPNVPTRSCLGASAGAFPSEHSSPGGAGTTPSPPSSLVLQCHLFHCYLQLKLLPSPCSLSPLFPAFASSVFNTRGHSTHLLFIISQ